MIPRTLNFIGALVFLAVPAFAQDFDLINHPGYVNLEDIKIPDEAVNVTEVSIGPELFQMIRNFSGNEAVGMPKLDGFMNIQVKTFSVNEKVARELRPRMEKLEARLRRENWVPLVRVRSGEVVTNISVKYSKDSKKTHGLFIMSLDPQDEAAFVNIVGNVDMNMLRNMNLGIQGSALDSLKKAVGD
ncbi:MAG TPA: DUF4252 domain-containing protein [bacterium]|nr:DUF4252 domain-containing protein [bacterium]